MAQRGKKSRPKAAQRSALLNRNPHPAFLDLKGIHPNVFRDVPDSLPSPFCLRKQETDHRIRILEDKGRNWVPTRRKGRVIRDWVESITSTYRLTEEQLLQRSDFDDIVTLFLEYHWRRIVLGPGDALALVGLTLRHSLCSRTYSRRTTTAYKKPCRRSHKRRFGGGPANPKTPDALLADKEDMMSHHPFRPAPDSGWPRRDEQKSNKRPRVEDTANYRFGGHYPGSLNTHSRPHYSSAANTGWSQLSPPVALRARQRQPYRNPIQQPHVAHAYNPLPRQTPGHSTQTHQRRQPVAPFPPRHVPQQPITAPCQAKQAGVTPPYRHQGPGRLPPLTEPKHRGSRTHHQSGASGQAAPTVITRIRIPEPPRKPDLPLGRFRSEQEAGRSREREVHLQALEEGEKARQEVEQAILRFSQAPMHAGVAPKAIVDLTKNLPARSLPKFTKSTKKRKVRDESQFTDPRASACRPSNAPKPSSPLSSADTVETSETTTTLFEDDYPTAASPSNDTVIGSPKETKALEATEEGTGALEGPGGEEVITNPTPEPQTAAEDAASKLIPEPQTAIDDVSVELTPNSRVAVEDIPIDGMLEPQVAQGGELMVEQSPKPQVAAESIPASSNIPPRFRLSRLVSRPTKEVLPVVEPESRPTESVVKKYSEKSMPPVPHIPPSGGRLSPRQTGPLPAVAPIVVTKLEDVTQMQIDEQEPFPQRPNVTGSNLVVKADRSFCLPLPVPEEAQPHKPPQPRPFTVTDQKAPLVGSVPVPPEPEVLPYRPLKTLRAYPPIWAETRQEVCESFEWFRSYQGGVYFSHDTVRGYLLSAFGAKRDIFAHEGRLIISHGGGKAESIHKERGQCVLRGAEDQRSDDKSVRALLKTYRDRRPIALVIDDRYAKFPYDLGSKGVTYAVLGFYMIVQAWAEVQPDPSSGRNIVKFKFAFQWCEGQGDPWWLSESGKADIVDFNEDARSFKVREEYLLREQSPSTVLVRECPQCWEESPQVYSQGWACLQPTCPRFWQLGQTHSTPTDPLVFLPEELTYHEGFLALREPCPLPIGFETLRPPPVKERADGISTSHYFTRGFHCDKCGRLSCRVEWQKWKCNTPGCDKAYAVKAKVREAKEFWSQPITTRYLTAELAPSAKINRLPSRSFLDEAGNLAGMIDTFVLPEQRGFLHHIQPPGPHSRLEANDIFRKYQEQANDGSLAFKRWPMRAHKCRGALLTNYFSHNAGEPYHYVGGTDNTVPFDKAPSAVVDARALIQRRISQALGRRAEFNEVLTAAYMEKQKMAFHSDEEVGLGPLVAGLSLGSPAFMHFRLQRKHDRVGERKGILMSFILRHGDVFVMDGIGVQKFYEHTVVPTNFRIAATARSIDAPAPLTQAINRPKPIGHSHVPSAPIVSVKVKVEPPPVIALTPLELVCGPMLTMPELASQFDS